MKFGVCEGKSGDGKFVTEQCLSRLSNGYGVSVIRGGIAYSPDNIWEFGVLRRENGNSHFTQTSPIVEGAISYLSDDEVASCLQKVEMLPSVEELKLFRY